MSFWKWIGSDQRIEEALAQTTTINVSPSTDDITDSLNTPLQWGDIVAGGASNTNVTGKSKLSLWTDYQPAVNADNQQLWTEKSKG